MTTGRGLESLPVGLFGINERSRRMLEVLFSMHGKERYRVAGDETPRAAVVDMDGADADALWNDYRARHPGLPTVVISVRGQTHPGAVSLKKPVTPQALLEALDRYNYAAMREMEVREDTKQGSQLFVSDASSDTPRPALVSHIGDGGRPDTTRVATSALEDSQEDDVCGDADDADPRYPEQLRAMYFNPEHRFHGACIRAMELVAKSGEIHLFSLENLEYPLVFLPSEGGQVITCLSQKRLRIFCLVPLADVTSAIAPLKMLPPDLAESPRVPFERFQWDIALWTSRGHLPEGTPLDVPLRLKHWPNFTRLTETPHAMSIAALWTRKPHSLLETSQTLGVPRRYVFAFFSAVESAGLIEWVDRREASGTPLLGVEHKGERDRRRNAEQPGHDHAQGERRGLLGRILSHLLHHR